MQTGVRKAHIVIFLLVLTWFSSLLVPCVTSENGLTGYLLCQLFHANIFHLASNSFVLYGLRFSWMEFTIAYIIGAISMAMATESTLGASAIIYAILAFRMMESTITLKTWALFIAINGITAFIPHIAFCVHMAAFVMGIVFVLFKRLSRRYNDYRRIVERR